MNWDPYDIIDIKSNPYQQQISKLPFPSHITLKDYLAKFCDFLGTPSKVQIYELSKYTNNKEYINELEFL